MTDWSSAPPPLTHSADAPVVLAIVGPTATGKTALAFALAERLPIEVISADSRMVYRWMNIGTAKPSAEELSRLPHHLVDVVDPDEPYSVALYRQQALAAIARVHARGRLPALVGGTGLYVRAVCDGLQIPAVPPDPEFRAALARRAAEEGWQALQAELAHVDPASAARIDPRNVRRVIRALEVARATGVPFSAWQQRRPPPFRTVYAGLDLPREVLYERINRRVDEQIAAGLIDEVRSLLDRGFDPGLAAMSGFGYREIGLYLLGALSLEEAIAQYKQATRHYARRQRTWFRPDQRIRWFDARKPDVEAIAGLVDNWGNGSRPPPPSPTGRGGADATTWRHGVRA